MKLTFSDRSILPKRAFCTSKNIEKSIKKIPHVIKVVVDSGEQLLFSAS